MGNKVSSDNAARQAQKNSNMDARIKFVESRMNTHLEEEGETQKTDVVDGAPMVDLINRKKKMPILDRTASCLNVVDRIAISSLPHNYKYDFENLVLEGGGSKGLAYCGAIKYLQEVGIMKNIKRIAGTSAGSMTAALFSVGYTADEIQDFLGGQIADVFLDHKCGYCSLLPNLLSGYGWNPGKKIFKWFGDKMEQKTGNPDITFKEVYRLYGIELCVVVTNLSQMSTEYCHPKTTPDMSIRLAVRMSMAIPGVYKAVKYKRNGETSVYVDGGVLCNYPIHCFDGWYLSMARGDSFIQKLQPLSDIPKLYEKSDRFGTYNSKTLGFLLFADSEEDVYRHTLERRVGVGLPEKPAKETEIYLRCIKEKLKQNRAAKEHGRVINAVNTFLGILKKHNLDQDDVIDRGELEAAFKDTEFTNEEKVLLFGENVDFSATFNVLDADKNGKIQFEELIEFIESTGVCFQVRFLGFRGKPVKDLGSFLDSLQSTLLTNVKKVYVDERDMARTVGINTGHIGTTDFKFEEEDMDFVVERGYNATKAYLQYYIAMNNMKPKTHSEIANY
ncbi:hypothetical protein SNE40_000482 [Patella caerulea]|uniref:Uncharacterized protein n=1 Tax=Patella caerulea TaxID=87958 RepID=A0AAN8KLD2_PATCE